MDILARETTMSAGAAASLVTKDNDTNGAGGRHAERLSSGLPSMLLAPWGAYACFLLLKVSCLVGLLSLVCLEDSFPYARCLTVPGVITTV